MSIFLIRYAETAGNAARILVLRRGRREGRRSGRGWPSRWGSPGRNPHGIL